LTPFLDQFAQVFMPLRSSHLLRARLSLGPDGSNQLAGIAGWLVLSSVGGIVYFWARANNTWLFVSVFVASLFLLVALGILWEWLLTKRTPINSRNAILLGVLFWLLLDPLLMREGIQEFAPDVVLTALLYSGIFLALVCIGYVTPPISGVKRLLSGLTGETNDNRVFWFTLVIYLLGMVPLIYASGGSISELWRLLLAGYSPDVEVGWRRGMLGDQVDFLKSATRLLQLSVPFLGTYLLFRPLLPWKKVLIVLMTVSLLLIIFFSGERRVFGLIVLGPLLYTFLSLNERVRKTWSLAFVMLALLLFWLMQAQVQFRAAGFYDFDARAVEANPLEMHRDNNFYWFATAVDTMPNTYDFTNDWVFPQVLTHPIPRFIWPGKPYAVGLPFVQWEDIGASLSISIVGELYVGQGLLGIVLGGFIYGWLARNCDQMRDALGKTHTVRLVYCLGLTLLLIGVRSFGDLVGNWYVLLLVALTLRYSGIGRRSRQLGLVMRDRRFEDSGVSA
jgi:oligosaccharide repeat unit polymerase